MQKIIAKKDTNENYFDKCDDSILLQIFDFLPKKDLLTASLVCKRFFIVSSDNKLWSKIAVNYLKTNCPNFNPEEPQKKFSPQDSIKDLYLMSIYKRFKKNSELKKAQTISFFTNQKKYQLPDRKSASYDFSPLASGLPIGQFVYNFVGKKIERLFMNRKLKKIHREEIAIENKFKELKLKNDQRFKSSIEDALEVSDCIPESSITRIQGRV